MDWLQETHDESRRTYDNGGPLPVGLVQVMNTSDKPTPVYTACQYERALAYLKARNECHAPRPPAPDA